MAHPPPGNAFRAAWPTISCRNCRKDTPREIAIRVPGRYGYNLCPACVEKRRRLGCLPPGMV